MIVVVVVVVIVVVVVGAYIWQEFAHVVPKALGCVVVVAASSVSVQSREVSMAHVASTNSLL